MIRFLLAAALCAPAIPAVAMTADTMSCADFAKMDDADRMAAMEPAEGGMMAQGTGTMAAGDSSGTMAAGGDSSGGMMDAEHSAMMAATACEAHPDMTVGEAMKSGN